METAGKKQIVRDIFEQGWNRQQFAAIAPFLAVPIDFHFRGATHHTALAHLQETVAAWRRAFPDLTFAVVDIVAEGDLVAANLVMAGTQHGPWKDVPAHGNRFQVEVMFFFRFAQEQIVEMWEVYDELAMRAQLSA